MVADLRVSTLPAGLLAVLVAGCCTTAPSVEKYFDRRTPLSAFLGFAYAIETGSWTYALESLDDASREEIGSTTRLWAATKVLKDPDFGIPIGQIITQAVWHREDPEPWRGRADLRTITVHYTDDPHGDFDPKISLIIVMILQEGEWKVDLLNTIALNYPDQGLPAEDPA